MIMPATKEHVNNISTKSDSKHTQFEKVWYHCSWCSHVDPEIARIQLYSSRAARNPSATPNHGHCSSRPTQECTARKSSRRTPTLGLTFKNRQKITQKYTYSEILGVLQAKQKFKRNSIPHKLGPLGLSSSSSSGKLSKSLLAKP